MQPTGSLGMTRGPCLPAFPGLDRDSSGEGGLVPETLYTGTLTVPNNRYLFLKNDQEEEVSSG